MGAAMIDLDALVAVPGMRPLTARVGPGEVVLVEAPAPVGLALFEVIAGLRRPIGGQVRGEGGAPRAVLVRPNDRWPPGRDPARGLRRYAAAWGRAPGDSAAAVERAVACAGTDASCLALVRGQVVAPEVWLIAGAGSERAGRELVAITEAARSSSAAVLWLAGEATAIHADRHWRLEGATAPVAPARPGAAPAGRPRVRALAGAAIAAAVLHPSALALAAVGALLAALCLVTAAAYEGYAFAAGSTDGLRVAAIASALVGGFLAGVLGAAVGGRTPRDAAMMMETPLGVAGVGRLLALEAAARAAMIGWGTAAAPLWAAQAGALSWGQALGLVLVPPLTGALAAATAVRVRHRPLGIALVGVGWAAGAIALVVLLA